MLSIWANQLKNGTPFKHFEGKSSKVHSFISLYASMALLLDAYILLGLSNCGFCEEVGMVSVPLGFEVSGFDKATNWVSQNGVFAFGFLVGCYMRSIYDDNNDGVFVGIRYNLGNKFADLPVWTVGGGLRVSENSTFRLSEDGRLVLFENTNGFILWSSNTSKLGVQKASLLDNGNLVLLGTQDEVVWQSFNSPTSSLLPGQSFHFPQSLRAPSTKSISSYYNLVIRPSGELALVWESNVTYWKGGGALNSPSPAIITKVARFDSDGILGVFDFTNKSIWSITSKDFQDSSVSLRHLRIDTDGNLRIYSWYGGLKMWKVGWQAVENQCNVFGSCGLYSLCGFNSSGPVCNCLHEGTIDGGSDSPGSDLSISGCKKLVDLGNCKMRTSMMVLKNTVLYGLYPPHDFDVMLNEDDCKAYCSNDTSCIAATSKNDGSGLCTVKRTSFISGYSDPSLPAISFLKICLVPQAVSARKANPQGEGRANTLSSGRIIAHTNAGKFFTALALIGLATALVILAVEILVVLIVYRRRKDTVMARISFDKDAQKNPQYSALVRLSFEEIKELTSDFASQLGPSIFKGILPNQTPIIVKLLNNVVVSEKDFRTAVSILGGTHHRNLVAVKGFCCDRKNKFLIYECVPCGSLDKWLFDRERNPNELHWQERLDIALGVARALAYLHLECQSCVAHGNLKLENVMLDQNLVPKLMDFGLQGIFQEEAGSSSESASERDIYKFGLILLQIARLKRDPPSDDVNPLINEIVETQKLEGRENYERVERVVRIALWCVQTQPFLRPSVGEVVKVLEGTLSVDRPPSSFAFRSGQQIEEEEHNEIQELL